MPRGTEKQAATRRLVGFGLDNFQVFRGDRELNELLELSTGFDATINAGRVKREATGCLGRPPGAHLQMINQGQGIGYMKTGSFREIGLAGYMQHRFQQRASKKNGLILFFH